MFLTRDCHNLTGIFYAQVDSFARAGKTQTGCMILPTKDYLFRHDRGSFWMARDLKVPDDFAMKQYNRILF